MRKINPKSSDVDSFKYSILFSLHYYDISEFETNNSNISLTIFNEDNKKIYHWKNDSTNKAHIVQLKNNRYAALQPPKNKFMRLDKMVKSFSHKELKEYILSHINSNDSSK